MTFKIKIMKTQMKKYPEAQVSTRTTFKQAY